MALNPGDLVYLDYGEQPALHHTRIVLSCVDEQTHHYMILTPDHDIYCEMLHASNPDIVGIVFGPPDGAIPAALGGANIYGFRPMAAGILARYMREGRDSVAGERAALGLGAIPAAPGAQAEVWVLAEMIPGRKIGEQLQPPAGFPVLGSYGLMEITDSDNHTRPCLIKRIQPDQLESFCEERVQLARSTESLAGEDRIAAEDIRTMAIHYTANGECKRHFKDTLGEMTQCELEDFPFEVRTCLEYVQAIGSIAESCHSQHLAWVHQLGIPSGSRAIYEDEVLSQVIDTAIQYDALNISNLASFELICRRRQLLAEAHSYNPSSPSYEGSDHWMGQRYKHGGAVVVPRLTEHVSKKLQAESQILKERRKLEEAKGRGRGKGGGAPKDGQKGGRGGGSDS